MPDVLVLSKAIGGGLPLAVVVYNERLDVWKPGAHAGTFRGNVLAMSAGLATLRHIQQHELVANALRCGERLMRALRQLLEDHPFLGDVRGHGLMIGIEVVAPDRPDGFGRPSWDGERARRLQRAFFERHMIVELGVRNGSVVRLLPPLIIGSEELDRIVSVLADACTEVGRVLPPS